MIKHTDEPSVDQVQGHQLKLPPHGPFVIDDEPKSPVAALFSRVRSFARRLSS